MKAACFAVLALCFAVCFATNDVYMGGDFLLSVKAADDDDLNHIASLASYSPEEDMYLDTFDGGVFLNSGYLDVLQDTHLGVFGAGYFSFVGNDYHYSNSVVLYNHDDDDFEPVSDGIYCRNAERVAFITGTNDYTVFAGNFDSIEYLSQHSSEDVPVVPNIAKIDADFKWSTLSDPNGVFPESPIISGLTSNDDTVFIYATARDSTQGGNLYSWDDSDHMKSLNQARLLSDKNIAVDTTGNVAGLSFTSTSPGGAGDYNLVVFKASQSWQTQNVVLHSVAEGVCPDAPSAPSVYAYADGFLISVPLTAASCQTVMWSFFNSTTMTLNANYMDIPDTTPMNELAVGDDNSLWMVSYNSNVVSYLPPGAKQFVEIDLSVFGTFTVSAITWDNGPDKLLVYGSSSTGRKLLEINPEAFPPVVKEKNPGMLANPGTVASLAVMDDPDDDDYELYIGGNFDSIANGLQVNNFVRYKAGQYDSPLPNLPPITAMVTSNSTIFYATNACSRNGGQLPVGYYSKDSKDMDVWVDVPVVFGGTGCVTALFANEDFVFIGGAFTVYLPGTTDASHGLVYFNRVTKEWGDVPIPNTIGSSSHSYDITVISAALINGTYYMALGGHFDFTASGYDVHSFVMYNLSTKQMVPPPPQFAVDTIITSIIIDEVSRVYIGGNIQLSSGGSQDGLFVFDMNASTYSPVGDLPAPAASLLIFNSEDDDDNAITYLYVGGEFTNDTKHAGLVWTDASTLDPTSVYQKAGEMSQYLQYYEGIVNSLIYETGGVGQNDANGADPEYSPPNLNGDDGMSGWGVFFLTVFILLVIAVLVGGIAFGGFTYYRKRQSYQEL